MLTMGKMYESIKKHDDTMHMTKLDFFCCFLPENLEFAQELYDSLKATASYRSMFFNGNMTRRGLNDKIEKIIVKLNTDFDSYVSEITASAATFLESYGNKKNGDWLKDCLNQWRTDIQEEAVLCNYISARENNPDSYADILAVLYLYTLTLWKKTAFLKLLAGKYKNGVSEEWTFDVERVGLFADCGKERTILETAVIEKNGTKWLDIRVNFAPNLIRPEVPNWCIFVFKMRPPRDIRYFHTLSFRILPVNEFESMDGQKHCGIEQVIIEVKPENRWQIRHHSHTVDLRKGPQYVNVYLKDVNPEILKQFEELCFVVNLNDLAGVSSGNPEELKGHFRISQVRMN